MRRRAARLAMAEALRRTRRTSAARSRDLSRRPCRRRPRPGLLARRPGTAVVEVVDSAPALSRPSVEMAAYILVGAHGRCGRGPVRPRRGRRVRTVGRHGRPRRRSVAAAPSRRGSGLRRSAVLGRSRPSSLRGRSRARSRGRRRHAYPQGSSACSATPDFEVVAEARRRRLLRQVGGPRPTSPWWTSACRRPTPTKAWSPRHQGPHPDVGVARPLAIHRTQLCDPSHRGPSRGGGLPAQGPGLFGLRDRGRRGEPARASPTGRRSSIPPIVDATRTDGVGATIRSRGSANGNVRCSVSSLRACRTAPSLRA